MLSLLVGLRRKKATAQLGKLAERRMSAPDLETQIAHIWFKDCLEEIEIKK
jgi:hypothetical protein